ncbi:hypothetical protein EJ03DRAFT_378481 [Teratosphaeria nubilosa]|uniref:Uncharacterized protein n=1 Tax=Teratosphaeria nubilosa TaxID=161662 RepID=A0A6G1KX73_9PEZI|nr:hypothetical protein EJ03DRAFT_378481 [Teratosphaeria nubilosa]
MALLTPPPSTEKTYPSFHLPSYEDIFGPINEDEIPANQVERCETESDSDEDEDKNRKAPSNIGFFNKYAVPVSKRVIRSKDDGSRPSHHGQVVNEEPRYRIDPMISKKHSVPVAPTKLTPKKYGMFGKTEPSTKATSAGDEFAMSGGLGEYNKTTGYDSLRARSNGGYTLPGEELGDLNDGFQTPKDNAAGSPYETYDQEAFNESAASTDLTAGAPTAEDQFVSDQVQDAEEDFGYAADQEELREEVPAVVPKKRGRPRKQPIIDVDMIGVGRTRSWDKRTNEQERSLSYHTRSFKRLVQPVVPSKRNKANARAATLHKKAKKTVSFADLTATSASQGGSEREKLVRGVRPGVHGQKGTRRLSPLVILDDDVVNLEEYEKHY